MLSANQHLTLADHLVRTAELLPDKCAFQCSDQYLSYSELLQHSRQLSACLEARGVLHQETIALLLPRCLEYSIATYGVMYGGRVYLPIDSTLPVETVRSILIDCGVCVLITHPQMTRFVCSLINDENTLHTIIGLESDSLKESSVVSFSWSDIKCHAVGSDSPNASSDDVAYVIHTSGSTGRPKGIVHTHGSGSSYARLSAATFNLSSNDVIGSHGPLHTDMCTLGLLAGPLVGATVDIISDAHVRVPASLSSYIENNRISVWYSVPQVLVQLVVSGVLNQRDLSSLRWVIYAGEALAPNRILQLVEHVPDAQICNVYGPAETNQCMHHIVSGVEELQSLVVENRQVPIGNVWSETSILLLNEYDEEVKPGEVGELVVHSSTLMKEYWHSSRSVTEIYFDNPKDQQRYYRTGDLASRDESGLYTLVGRRGRQVKVRGMRVELDSIELLLAQHPSIVDAVAIAENTSDDPGSCVIRAFVTLHFECEVSAILAFARTCMPRHAVPESIEVLPAMPLTSGGKVDRLQLREQIVVV